MKIIISLFFLYLISKNIYINLNYNFQTLEKTKATFKIVLFKKILIFKKEKEQGNTKKETNGNFIRDVIVKEGIHKKSIENIKLKMFLSTENILFTIYSIPAISTILAVIFNKYVKNKEESYFEVKPVFKEKNIFKVNLQILLKIKLVHIIKIVCYILKKKRGKYGKTSNRKSYGHSDAKY